MRSTVSLREVTLSCFLLCQHVKRTMARRPHLGMSRFLTQTLSVLACVWYVGTSREKQGCVGANLSVGPSHVSASSSEGEKTLRSRQVVHEAVWTSVWASRLLSELGTRLAALSRRTHTFTPASPERSWGKQNISSGEASFYLPAWHDWDVYVSYCGRM